jgi:hypothetical protein
MRAHDIIVKELKEMLESKGIECLHFHRKSAEVMRKGFLNSETEICGFTPDIIVKAGVTDEDIICIEYINSKRQLRSDARGMALLSLMGYLKAQSFVLVLNDNIVEMDRGTSEKLHLHQINLSMFKKYLNRDSKESFLAFIRF